MQNSIILEKVSDIEEPNYNLPKTDIVLVKSSSFQPHHLFKDEKYENLQPEQFTNLDKKSIKSLKLIADKFKSSSANAWIGSNYLYGINNFKINLSKSKEYLLKANKSRHPKATFDLYVLYEMKGQIKKSFEYLEESAEYGYEEAIIQLGQLCLRGENQSRAMYLFKLSIELKVENYSRYHSMIGEMYYHGLGVPTDHEYAFKVFYDCSIRKNEYHSYFHLSQCYLFGYGVEKDYKKAIHWLSKCPLDLDGEVSNCFGILSLRGSGIQQDFKNALKLFEIARSKGYPFQMINYNIQCANECLSALECNNIPLIYQILDQQLKEETEFNYKLLKPASLRNQEHFSVPNFYNNPSSHNNNILGTIIFNSIDIALEFV